MIVGMIKKRGGSYELRSKDGSKKLGTYKSKGDAKARERQVQYFKHHAEALETLSEELGYLAGLTAHDGTTPSHETVIAALCDALDEYGRDPGALPGGPVTVYRNKIVSTFPTYVVYCDEDGKLWRQDYSLSGSAATLTGEPEEVTAEFMPMEDGAQQEARELVEGIALIEAAPAGKINTAKFDRVNNIIEGTTLLGPLSSNGVHRKRVYSEAARTKVAKMAEGLPAYANHTTPDLAFKPRDVKELIGRHHNVRLDPVTGMVKSDLHLLKHQAPWVFSLAEKMGDVVGNSLVSKGIVRMEGDTEIVDDILLLRSGDLVSDPATTRGLFEAEVEVQGYGRIAHVGIRDGQIDVELQESTTPQEEPVELSEILKHLKDKPQDQKLLAEHFGFLPKADGDKLAESVLALGKEKETLAGQVATLTTEKETQGKQLAEATAKLDGYAAKDALEAKRAKLATVIAEHDLGKKFGTVKNAISDKFKTLLEGMDEASWKEQLDDRLALLGAAAPASSGRPTSTLSEHATVPVATVHGAPALPEGIFQEAARVLGR